MLCRKVNDNPPIHLREVVDPHNDRPNMLPDSGIECASQILKRSHIEKLKLNTQAMRRDL